MMIDNRYLIDIAEALKQNCADHGDNRTGCCDGCPFHMSDRHNPDGYYVCELTSNSPDEWRTDEMRGNE